MLGKRKITVSFTSVMTALILAVSVYATLYMRVSTTPIDVVYTRPRLWIWRHGAKVWPEWQVGYYDETQVLYARIVNDGNQSAFVKVEFIIYGPLGPESVESNISLCDGIPPGNVTVSAEYHPPSPGTFYFQAILYYSFDTIIWKPWSDVQDLLGGEGISRTASSKFKVFT